MLDLKRCPSNTPQCVAKVMNFEMQAWIAKRTSGPLHLHVLCGANSPAVGYLQPWVESANSCPDGAKLQVTQTTSEFLLDCMTCHAAYNVIPARPEKCVHRVVDLWIRTNAHEPIQTAGYGACLVAYRPEVYRMVVARTAEAVGTTLCTILSCEAEN